MSPTYEELTAELKSLKKRLYTFKLKGLELQQKARNHFMSHRMAAISGEGEGSEVKPDIKLLAFGTEYQRTPLSNEYILEMIASFLPLKDLQTCKNVCKLWSQEMSRCELKRKSLVVAHDDVCEEVDELVEEKLKGNLVNIATLIILSASLQSNSIHKVVSNFGETISGLKLDDCTITAEELYSLLRNLPCLDNFSVKKRDLPSRLQLANSDSPLDQITSALFNPVLVLPYLRNLSWEDTRSVIAVERLPRNFPNLVCLRIENLGVCTPDSFINVRWDSLKFLKIASEEELTASHFKSLTNMQLKLNRFVARDIRSSYSTLSSLKMFLSPQDALSSLKLMEGGNVQRAALHPPQNCNPFPLSLPSLKLLVLDIGLINSLEFVNSLESALRVDVRCYYWINWWTVINKSSSLNVHSSSITEICLGAIDGACLGKIATYFPNISNLNIAEDRVDDSAFRVICSSFPKLRILRIRKACQSRKQHLLLTDSGITGIDDKKILLSEKIIDSDQLNLLRVNPFIGSLKELEILEINSAPTLTDASLFYGFAEMQNLLIISLPKCKISDTAFSKYFPHYLMSKDSDGSRKIQTRSMKSCNENFSKTLLSLVASSPFSLYDDLAAKIVTIQ